MMAFWRNASNRAKSWAGALGLYLVLCLAAFTPAHGAAAPENSVLKIGVGRDLFDGPDSRTYVHGSTNTWEALTYLGPKLEAQPWLAESWRSEDQGRTWIFRLRSGVRFHNGSLLTNEDAALSIKRIMSRPKYDPTGLYRDVTAVETKGDREIVFRLARPSPAFANLVAYYSSPIIHPS